MVILFSRIHYIRQYSIVLPSRYFMVQFELIKNLLISVHSYYRHLMIYFHIFFFFIIFKFLMPVSIMNDAFFVTVGYYTLKFYTHETHE